MTDSPLRILVLADARSFHTERFVAEVRNQGCEVMAGSLEPGEMECRRLRRRGPISSIAYALARREVEDLIRSFRPDVISAHYAAGYGYLMSRVKHDGIPATLHVWGSDVLVVPKKSWLHRRKVVAGLSAADHIFADSQYLADAVRSLVPTEALSVSPWGIERRHLFLHKRDYAPRRPLAVIVPRLHEPIYDNLFIVEALQEEIRAERIRITFPAFGSKFRDFRARADALTGGRVRYYEKLPRPEFLTFMATHDVYLSAAQSDSSPVTLIEAMALGLIPVAADIPGVREWLTPESGLAYRPKDAVGLRAVVHRLTDSDEPYEGMRRANLGRVEALAVFEDNVASQLAVMRTLHQRVAR